MASKSFQVSIDFIGNISDLQSKIKQVTGEISKIGATSGGVQVQKQFEQLVKTVTDLQTRASQPIGSKAEFNKLASEASKVEMTYNQLLSTIERLQSSSGKQLLEFLPKSEQDNIRKAADAIKEYGQAKKDAERIKTNNASYHKLVGELKLAEEEAKQLSDALKKAEAAKTKAFGTTGKSKIAAEFEKASAELKNLETQRRNFFKQYKSSGFETKGQAEAQAKSGATEQIRKEAEEALAKYEQLKQSIKEAQTALDNSKGGQLANNLEAARKAADAAKKNVATLQSKLQELKVPEDGVQKLEQAFENLKTKAKDLGVNVKDIGSSAQVETLLNRLNQLESDGFIQGAQIAQQYAATLREVVGGAIDGLRGKTSDLTNQFGQFMTAQEDMSMLQSRLKYFFSLTNSIQLLKRTITSAMNTVKELDAVMTETAVVTDFTVGDMWNKLPEYASQASALGASIKDLYSATTLYYQQGLNSTQAMSVGIETMKMARIAGMDAADATQAMTAALRGFNMEINETSATRVNDVYSKLAAITAADTEQIATAMSKTASIAASANMEFETTSALLAQIIETTQEAPETAGTAMKTIIARFTEVKKLFGEGMLSGEDEEGEVIEINKIDAALRTVGISLTDFLKGEKGIDDIFLELASKWNTLDLATQRYIATTAAGSRQQSRFIAMMSNYDRTMELVTAANNSAGASQEQFDKTLDSMEAKLQKLKNAWAEFTMGIANNEILKGGIDLLTKLLETVNKLTTALSGNSGIGKSILNLMTVIGALSGGKMLLQKGFGTIGTWMGVNQGTGQPQKITAWQRAKEYSKSGQGAKQKVGYYATGLFAEKQDRKFQETLDKKQMLASRQEQLDKLRNMNRRASGIGAEKLSSHYDNLEIKFQGAGKAVDELKGIQQEFEKTGQVSAKNAKVLEQYGLTAQDVANSVYPLRINLQAVGAAAMLAGGAFGLLANALDKNGMKEAAEVCRTLSTVITGLGGVLMMLPMVLGGTSISLKGFKLTVLDAAGAGVVFQAAFWQIALVAAIVVGVIWGLVAAFQAIHDSSPEGKLKAATEAANDAAEAAENAAQAYEHLATALGSISGKSAALEDLAIGTSEWKKAVQELNGEVLDLVEQYPELAKFVDSNKGYLTLDKNKEIEGETVDSILGGYQDNIAKAQSAKAAAQLNKQQAQQVADFSNLSGEAKLLKTRKLTDEEIDNIYGKWTGKAVGAKIAGATTTQLDKQGTDELARAIVNGQAKVTTGDKITTVDFNGESLSYENDVYAELREYGDSLLAGDAAVKVFTDTLLSNALMIADVSEEQKANMMNFMSSEQIDNIREDKKDTIEENGIDDEEKKQYAEAMGYDFINGKFYVGTGADQEEVAVSDDSIAAQLAGIQTQEDLTGRMEALDGILGSIKDDSADLPGIFERMTEKGEGAAMTFDDVGKMKEALDKAYVIDDKGQNTSELFNTYEAYGLESVYGSYEEFINFLTNSAELANNQYSKATENLDIIGMSDIINSMEGLDISQTKNISDLLYTSVLQSGQESGRKLAEQLKTGLEDEDYGVIFAEALDMIDISNIDSIESLSEILTELNYNGKLSTEKITLLEQQIIEATKATHKFNLDALKEEIKNVQGLIDDISEREDTERIFTEEERNIMTKADSSLESQFVMTGIDEFVYVGDSMQGLVTALNQNTAALLGKTGEQLKSAAAESEKWAALTSDDASEVQQAYYNTLKEIAEGATQVANAENLIPAMQAVGLYTSDLMVGEDGKFDQNATTLIADRIKAGWEQYGSINAQAQNIGNWENWQTSMPQIYYSSMTGQGIISDGGYIDPNTNQAIPEQDDMTARTDALNAKLVQQEGGMAEADSTYNSLAKENSEWGKHNNLVKAAVVDSAEYEKKLNKLADTVEENADALADSKKGTREYQKALGKVTEAAKDAFGDNITEDFVEENLDLFKEFAKGSEGSVEKIRDKIFESFAASEKYTGDTLTAIQNATEEIDGSNFDIYGHADASQAFSELAALMDGAQAAADYLKSLGYSVTWEESGSTTMQMPDGSTREIPNYRAVVTDSAGNAAGSRGGGGGGGGGGGSEWENPYDKLYNLTEKINQAIREREKLERRYDRLIERRQATAAELFENSQAEIESLEKQAELQQKMIDGRREMLQEEMDENKDLQKYATIDKETGQITINWDLINSVTDEEKGKKIEEYISKLEELRDSMQDAQDALEEIEDAIWEIEERGREEYLEFEDRIKEALVEVLQKEIDELEEINESINDTNSKLIDSIQNSIDKMRQDRENEETEEDLQEKQRRLAYLEQDTSSANAMEILDLRKEIREGQRDYTDSLIDQKISELQEQNEEAAEQREQQITIMQNQLDWYVESGRIWAEVEKLMREGMGPDGSLLQGSELMEILKSAESWKSLSEIGQMDWLLDLETLVAQSMGWKMSQGQLENLHEKKTGQMITFTNAKGEVLTGTVDEEGNVVLEDGTYYKDVYQWIDGTYHTAEEEASSKPSDDSSNDNDNGGNDKDNKNNGSSNQSATPKWWQIDSEINHFGAPTKEKGISDMKKVIDNYINKKINEVEALWKSGQGPQGIEYYNSQIKPKVDQLNQLRNTYKAGITATPQYKTGGLADFTGPAWLDGTKTRPELVLNQRDTQNFIQLKDILSSIMSRNFSSTSTSTENNGDITYDIDINVETMSSDYDVEQVASKVKSMIVDNARYRNNNAISLTR